MSNNVNYHIFDAELRRYADFPDLTERDLAAIKDTCDGTWHANHAEPPAEVHAKIVARIEALRAMKEATARAVEVESWEPPEVPSQVWTGDNF